MCLCWERGAAGWRWSSALSTLQRPEMSSDELEPGWEMIHSLSAPLPERGDAGRRCPLGLVHGRSHEHGLCAKNAALG